MNYDNPQLRELLTAEYVLGTLTGAARRRFERLLIDDARLRAEQVRWESRFAAWAADLPRKAPPARVWRRIERRLESARSHRPLWSSARLWQACTGFAVLALVAIVAWWRLAPAPAAPVEMAVVVNQAGKPVWAVSVGTPRNRVTVKVVGSAQPPAGKAYELWMLPGQGAAPVSLGVLPARGKITRHLSTAQTRALASARTLAVSIEPPGGSPTGLPTGPVVYTAPLIQT